MKELTIKSHLHEAFELGKKMFPVYLKLLLKLLPCLLVAALATFSIAVIDSFSVKMLGFLVMFVTSIYFMIISMQYEVSKIKGVAAVASGKNDVEKIWSDSKGNFWKMFFLGIVLVIVIGAGFMFFVLPGVYLLIVLSFTPFVAFLKDLDVVESMGKSFKIVKGNWVKVFVRGFVLFAISSLLMWPVNSFELKVDKNMDSMKVDSIANEVKNQEENAIKINRSFSVGGTYEAHSREEIMALMKVAAPFFIASIIYSLVAGFIIQCFGYSYWYILFKELEKESKVTYKN